MLSRLLTVDVGKTTSYEDASSMDADAGGLDI
jgi:hypothetical protein